MEFSKDLFGTKRKLNALFPKAAVDLTFPSTEDEETFVEDFDENEHHDDGKTSAWSSWLCGLCS